MTDTTIINLNINNPFLSALASKIYKPGYTNVPDTALPKAIRQQLELFYRTLTGNELPADSSTLLVKASKDNGSFERLYVPSLFKRSEPQEGQSVLFLKWGQTEIDLASGTKVGLYLAREVGEDGKPNPNENLTIQFADAEFGRGKDLALQFQLIDDASDQIIIFNAAIRLASYENKPELSALNVFAKRDIAKLAALIADAPGSGGGGGGGLPVCNLRDLELGAYNITGYRAVKTKYGIKYILKFAPTPELNQPNEFEAWGDKNVNVSLGSVPAPIISLDAPAVLTILAKIPLDDNKIRLQVSFTISQYEATEGGLSLDFN